MADQSGFTPAERDAMKQRAAELRASKGLKGEAKRQREAQACADAISELTGTDHDIAQLLDDTVTELAPHLEPKTFYGFPAYARDGKVLVFYQPTTKWETRYGTIAFEEIATLDDGAMWATAFAVLEVTDAVRQRVRELIERAVSG